MTGQNLEVADGKQGIYFAWPYYSIILEGIIYLGTIIEIMLKLEETFISIL